MADKGNEKFNKESIKKGKVCELVRRLGDKLEPANVLNMKYIDQNFHMRREMKLYEKKSQEKEKKNNK